MWHSHIDVIDRAAGRFLVRVTREGKTEEVTRYEVQAASRNPRQEVEAETARKMSTWTQS